MLVERARVDDIPAIEALLVSAGLPLEGAAAAFASGVVVREDERIVGAAAIEPYGRAGLLRSVVVAPDRRGTGLGRTVVAAAETLARDLDLTELYLLTETAEAWFPRLGYRQVERTAVPAAVRESIEFTTLCVDTGVAMHRDLPVA